MTKRLGSATKNWLVIASVGIPSSLLCLLWLKSYGISDETLLPLLRWTARAALLLFALAFIARPLVQLTPNRASRWLLKERRSFGVAFATMHTVHLALIAYRFNTIPGLEYGVPEAIVGGTAYLLMYLMLITSFDGPARAIGRKNWRRLHKTGIYYIGLIFVAGLRPDPGMPWATPDRLVFVAIVVTAIAIRVAAWVKTRRKSAA